MQGFDSLELSHTFDFRSLNKFIPASVRFEKFETISYMWSST